ncbi:DUF4864 domain-containing protein [Sulfitobacter guttiformis]|uniref:Uncharacterized protein DUF4864 n=1 Tax=Sulfitobacter guttiformis TaxID=74349 RepID=A0A420DTJ5_9RHOB|nr:DUF4864 domain-containing protein [Sulfitobacter guttiformis]KIN74903.1 hypothetical protein Z949_4109 [Sulfitobacter guttiformis KCTC 32187]RKE97469.1 uncharacterized protein DUF4864 [Sulfitobacter guttiformis]
MKMVVLAATFAMLTAFGAQAQDAEIRGTINQQFEAFKVDDFTTAFTFASPSLQMFFQNPQNFGRMVSQGYPMVWRPSRVDYLDLRQEDDTYWQRVQITDQKGRFHLLEYRMEQTPDGWRISGVQILDAPGAAV